MSIIICTVEEQNSLEKEPYTTFTKKYKSIRNDLNSKEIEIRVGSNNEGFSKGFYNDHDYIVDPVLKFIFERVKDSKSGIWKSFVRMTYSFECNECNFQYYQRHIKLLKKRVPYFYIPKASHFSFSSQLDDRFELQFDVLVKYEEDILQVCYSLINQIIAILSFED